jgi:DNA-binding NarL/FixJ family response regulator
MFASPRNAETLKKTIRILIVDDHPALCEGLTHRISSQPDMSVCGHARDVDEALGKVRELRPHLIIVDIALKESNGLDLVKAVAAHFKGVRTLVHSMYEESLYADRSLHAGAMGYVNKEADSDEVIRAIREITAGRVYLSSTMTRMILSRAVGGVEPHCEPVEALTDRQLEIFRLIGDGFTARQIANRLHISLHTVETHRENIKRKLNIGNAAELTRRAVLWAAEQP